MNKDFSFGQRDDFDRDRITNYVLNTFAPVDPLLQEIKKTSDEKGLPPIQVGSMDGLLLEVLTRVSGAEKAVEIGTLAGYSGVCILRGLKPGGKLYTFEFDSTHASVATQTFEKAGFKNQADVFVGPALSRLPEIESHGPFDLVFIDADKENYPHYLAWASRHLRVGGVLIGDNTFAFGMIANSTFENDEDRRTVMALREFNEKLAQKESIFRATLLPTGEGLTLAVKIRPC